MFGDISLLGWLGGAMVFAVGGGAGFFIARQIKDKHTLELEQKLEATQNKLNDYQEEVHHHFLKTSLLFNKLTDDYREVYEHLATGAQQLCNEKGRISALNLPENKILASTLAAETAPGPATAEAPSEEESAFPASNSAAQEDSPHLGAEGIVPTEELTDEGTDTSSAEDMAPSEATSDTSTTEQHTAEPAITESEPPAEQAAEATISAEELKNLEAAEKKRSEEEDIHLGAESTPGRELEHHKTHPSIH